MAMDESLFDLSPEQTDSTAMPRTVVFSNETGSGSMTICPLFSGAELYYNDMHLVSFDEAPVLARNVIEINHCRVGRYECSFGENSCCYLAAGDFAVCAAARKKSSSCFPLRHYHGITILLDLDAVSPEMRSQMEWYGVNLNAIRQYICTENRCCILRSAPVVAHVFSELYTAHAVPDTGYLRLKVLELLHILSRLKDRDDVQQTDYFNQHQVECVKQAAALLTQELTVHRTIEQLAQEVGLSPTALKSCFKGIYGSSVYASEGIPLAAGTEAADRNGQHHCRNCTPDRLRKSKQVFFRVSPGSWHDPDAISEDASDWIDFVCLVLVKKRPAPVKSVCG